MEDGSATEIAIWRVLVILQYPIPDRNNHS